MEATGMQAVVSALLDTSTGLTAAKMFAILVDIVPVIVFLIPIALGIYFFRKLAKGAGKAKIRL